MNIEDWDHRSQMISKALVRPFASIPLEIEVVLWEQVASLGTVADWKVGDSLRLATSDLSSAELRVGGHAVGSAKVVPTGKSAAAVQFAAWLDRTRR